MKSIVLIIFLYVLIAVNSGDAQVQYQVIDLGTLGTHSNANSININNWIVGTSGVADGFRAFLWQDGVMTDLGTLGGIYSDAYGINDAGQVVGRATLANNESRAFLWQNGNMINLGTLGGSVSRAHGINNNGKVVGYAYDVAANKRAFLWYNNAMMDLGDLGGTQSWAWDINESDQVVGHDELEGHPRAFLWANGTMIPLGALGGSYSIARSINDSGQIVGTAQLSNENYSAFLWQDGIMTHLGNLGGWEAVATDINNSGQVVGYSKNTSGQNRAVLWQDGNIFDLNDLIDPNPQWVLAQANGINDIGHIVGYGSYNGQGRAFLLFKHASVYNPALYNKWIAGETDTIRWTDMGWQFVNIKCMLNVGTPDSSEFVIENFYLADSSAYVWNIPDNLLSYRSKIIIENANNTEEKIESEIFRIKPYVLTRVTADSVYYDYQKARDQWAFSNTDEDMWPAAWYNQFNYTGTDPFTGLQYSQWQGDSVFNKMAPTPHAHMDWISWVNTFTVNACYVDASLGLYSPTATLKWWSTLGNWGGSCFGIAAANALAFGYKEQFQSKYPNFPAFLNPISVVSDTGVKKVVNELYTHQYGNPSLTNDGVKYNIFTPNETLDEIKQMLKEDNVQPKTLTIYNNSGSGGHTILGYELKRDAVQQNLKNVMVYDNSNPYSNNNIIINTAANGGNGAWTTADWPGWGGYKNIYLELTADNYLNNASFPRVSGNISPFILAENELEVNNSMELSIRITDTQGNITGFTGGLVLNEIPGSVPRILKNGSETPPYGYHLQTDNYSVVLNEFAEDTVNAFFFTGNKSFSYSRTGASQNHTDRLFFDGGVSAVNPDAQPKTVKLLNIINETTQEKLFAIRSLSLVQNDSVKIENPDDEKLKLVSYGSQKNYDIELNYVSQNGIGRFGDFSIPLSANTSHTFVPDWQNLETTPLVVLVDIGNNGTIDDTLYIINTVDVEDQGSLLNPDSYNLAQNYPNPFNPVTTIRYSIPQSGFVTLKIYDLLGREVAALVNEEKSPGVYEVQFDGSNLASGVYLYTLQAGEFADTKKFLLLK